jgi:hypothetical protein
VAAETAGQVTGGTLEACWGGDCAIRDLKFRDSTVPAESSCTGDGPDDVCSAKIGETGGKNTFAEFADLPQARCG